MSYSDNFKLADDIIDHLNTIVPSLDDDFLKSRYAGFVAVAAVTVYELAIKEIFNSFSFKKHKVLGCFVNTYFDRINGRIKTNVLKKDYLPRFGEKYVARFKRNLQKKEKEILRNEGVSILSAYNNIIQWRHQFAHEGAIPTTATFEEVVKAYHYGKEVIHCLNKTMRY